jgi:phage terminase Nu1 subunit (DNA packaging protein)
MGADNPAAWRTAGEMAVLFGHTQRWFDSHVAPLVPPEHVREDQPAKGRRRRVYYAPIVLDVWAGQRRRGDEEEGEESEGLERLRLANAQIAELRLAELQGHMVQVEAFLEWWDSVANKIRRGLEQVTKRHGQEVAKIVLDQLEVVSGEVAARGDRAR